MHTEVVDSRELLLAHVAVKFLLLISSGIAARVHEVPFEVIFSCESFVTGRTLNWLLRRLFCDGLVTLFIRLSWLFLLKRKHFENEFVFIRELLFFNGHHFIRLLSSAVMARVFLKQISNSK